MKSKTFQQFQTCSNKEKQHNIVIHNIGGEEGPLAPGAGTIICASDAWPSFKTQNPQGGGCGSHSSSSARSEPACAISAGLLQSRRTQIMEAHPASANIIQPYPTRDTSGIIQHHPNTSNFYSKSHHSKNLQGWTVRLATPRKTFKPLLAKLFPSPIVKP